MSETISSPGVVLNENNQSFTTSQPIEVSSAIVGPTVKGPVEVPTVVTSYSEYVNTFGSEFVSGSKIHTFLTSISAFNYFERGGTSLLVTRVTSGSFTPATSSFISGSDTPNNVFEIETLSEGEIMNSESPEFPNGALPSGSTDNLRFEITTIDTSSGTFNLLIRRGDDNTNSPVVLENWRNLSLDPFNPNYIEKVIGNQKSQLSNDGGEYFIEMLGEYPNQSNYVRVKKVNNKTPNYLDNNNNPLPQYVDKLPIPQRGTFGGAIGSILPSGVGNYYKNIDNNNTQGLQASDYQNVLNLLGNREEYKYKYITVPGLIYSLSTHTPLLNQLITRCRERGDTLAVIDTMPYGSMVNPTVNSTSPLDNTYAATYWPWVQTIDPNSGENIWIPASTLIPSVYAFNDLVAEPWFAPAGTSRGLLPTVLRAERNLQKPTRDLLYKANINPLITTPNLGVVVFGQKTLPKQKSALDRVNVRRLLIELKNFVENVANTLVFEQNTVATRNEFLSEVNPFLNSVQQREGLDDFRVIMDETNNTPTTIDNNELIGQIFIKPTKTVEFIIIDFNITPSGVTFE